MRTLRKPGSASFFVIITTLICNCQVRAQEPSVPDRATLEKMMQEFARMAPQHELLKTYAGTWKTENKSYYESPDKPTITQGTATFRLIMDGRFMLQEYKGEFNKQMFQGMGLTGYDKLKKRYVSVWVDNMGTGIMPMEGEYDEKTRTMTEVGVSATPMGEMKVKNLIRHISRDKFRFTMYMVLPDGSETKSLEITYTRQE